MKITIDAYLMDAGFRGSLKADQILVFEGAIKLVAEYLEPFKEEINYEEQNPEPGKHPMIVIHLIKEDKKFVEAWGYSPSLTQRIEDFMSEEKILSEISDKLHADWKRMNN